MHLKISLLSLAVGRVAFFDQSPPAMILDWINFLITIGYVWRRVSVSTGRFQCTRINISLKRYDGYNESIISKPFLVQIASYNESGISTLLAYHEFALTWYFVYDYSANICLRSISLFRLGVSNATPVQSLGTINCIQMVLTHRK